MDIHVPKEIEHYEPELQMFMNLMVRKLHICREKGFGENTTVTQMFLLLSGEVDELETALIEESQFDAVMEAVDVANQAWLLALVILRASRGQFEDQRPKGALGVIINKEEIDAVVQQVLSKKAPPPLTVPQGHGNEGTGEILGVTLLDPKTGQPYEKEQTDHRRPGGQSISYGHDGEPK